MYAPERQTQKKYSAYSQGTNPDMTNMTATLLLVSRIIVAVVAVETLGLIPMTSMRGPRTIPPPMPMSPATIPAKKVKKE
mmetsp:Transcript_10160/g.22005  ORF Transcript_10160/g.22005 Transcript_10160/m.22005 type:complete len:80 (-) Transcript_10160:1718-1957(-)